jgi:hypothetical protein
MSGQSHGQSGISIFGATFLVFLTLKLCGVIGWSWWWVTCPLWGPAAVVAIAAVVCIIVGLTWKVFSHFRKENKS